MGWVKAQPRPGWIAHPIRRWKDSVRFLFGRHSNHNYVRVWPNPGFVVTAGGYQLRYARRDGFKIKKVSG